MAASSIASWWQQALMVTTLFANTSDFAKTDVASISSSSFLPTYTPPPSVDYGAPLIANIKNPYAVNAQDVCPGYIATQVDVNKYGFTAHLDLLGPACNVYGTDIQALNLTVEYQARTRLHVNIKPSTTTAHNISWYDLPEAWVSAPHQEDFFELPISSDLAFSWENTPSFSFNVTRRATDEVIFSTHGSKLVYENQFIEFVTSMDSGYNLYGLGEVFRALRLQPGLTRTIYAADAGDPIDGNIYGSHPFYLETKYYRIDPTTHARYSANHEVNDDLNEYVSDSHGVYLRNAHAQEILMRDTNVTWRTLGGEIDLYFFSGPSQPEVTRQYLEQIGLPVLQQYWTFGYHQCRWGYDNWSMTEEVVNTFEKFEIPLETIWNDIDHMKGRRDFDNDPIRFPYDDGAKFLERLHERGQHYVPIVDAAIYIPDPTNETDRYKVFEDGYESNVYLLNPDGSLYIGQAWPGYTVFPDWFLSNTTLWWQRTVSEWYGKIPFDGLWIDMNEASSFCVGSCGSGNLHRNPVHPWFNLSNEPGEIVYSYPEGFNITNATEAASAASASSTQAAAKLTPSKPVSTYLSSTPTPSERNVNYPPYVINNIHGDLGGHAVSPNATHHNGVQEYDIHNLYGHTLLQNTYAAMLKINPGIRPFIIGRSTFVGSGNYSGHWGGDNRSQFRHMYWSIPQALSFSLFGIPMFGVDACGFSGNTDEELCNRWMQLSALFPFYRNHNDIGGIDQEPYVWSSVMEATKAAMNIRFQLLPYIYTLFFFAHLRGDTVMRALAWEFPNDPSLANADRQFFLGPAILVTPVLTQGHVTVDGVFPGLMEGKEIYYDWYNQSAVPVPRRKNTTIDAPWGHIPVYLRGGAIIAAQEMRMTTRDSRKTDWSLIVAMGVDGRAGGRVYLDDGVSLEPRSSKLVRINAISKVVEIDGKNVTRLRIEVHVEGDYAGLDTPLANITVLGIVAPPANKFRFNDEVIKGSAKMDYCADIQRLVISGLQNELDGRAWADVWSLEV